MFVRETQDTIQSRLVSSLNDSKSHKLTFKLKLLARDFQPLTMYTLIMPFKVPVRNDLVAPLSKWLDGDTQTSFEVTNPLQLVVPKPDFKSAACLKDLKRLAALRNCLSESLLDSHRSSIEEHFALRDCHEYHAVLLEFEKRGFPTVEDDCNGINLKWKGAFSRKQEEKHHSLVWDRACTMWNIAALESYLVSVADLTTKAGCREAVGHCQAAASILAILRDLVSSENYSTADMAVSMISFWEKLFLAQGQLCIYKMANLGDTVRQHTVLAYLSKACFDLYNEALQLAQDPRLQSEVPKQAGTWGAHCKAQSMMCCAKAEFHLAVDSRMTKQNGPEIYRLRQCVTMMDECESFVKSAGLTIPEVGALKRLAKDRLSRAESDNHQIYQDTIPKEMDDIRSQQLIKTNLGLPQEMMVPKVKVFQGV